MSESHDQTRLIERFLAGDPTARHELVDRWGPTVLQWCHRLSGPGVDAEDAAHDVFIIVLTRLDTLRDIERFPAWLFGITRRVLLRHRRRRWMRGMLWPLLPDSPAPGPTPERLSERSEIGERVQLALEKLPSEQREVLVLCELESRTISEVADLLKIPTGTVKSRLRLARGRLRRVARQMQLVPPDLVEV